MPVRLPTLPIIALPTIPGSRNFIVQRAAR